ncbi:MAG: hypothetical protein LBS14_04020 [Holosporaceae bacterium]|jgi:hypothetical protein|nr:hypothetical protein [Holosporaceae bacterium]
MNTKTGQVILATGELYPKFELKPGMMLLGADSQPHELHSVETRRVPAFEVTPQKSESFLIGLDQQILATSKTNEPLLLLAKDYIDLSKNFQKKFCLAKATLEFPATELSVDPYLLGMLLGNGLFRSAQIKLATLDFSTNFIPKPYLFSDKKSHKALFAGLLDTAGHPCFLHYDFLLSSLQLADDIAFLARSLGFTVFENRNPKTRGCTVRLYIHGNFSMIPIRIKRKFSTPHAKYFERFSVKPAGIQYIQYLNIESYLLGDCTVRIGDRP